MSLSRRAQALLYYLITTGQLQSRSSLAALFWPDMPEASARKNLRNVLPELRAQLGEYLLIDTEMIGLDSSRKIQADIHLLSQNLQNRQIKNDIPSLIETAALYQGDFLEGFSAGNAPFFEQWVSAEREKFHRLVLDALYQSAQTLMAEQNISTGLLVVRRLLEIEPTHEAAHRLLMRFLWMDGQRAAALKHYQQLQQLLLHELDVAPDPLTQKLFQEIQNNAPNHATLATKVDGTQKTTTVTTDSQSDNLPHNLPQQLTSFFGRSSEILTIRHTLLHPNCRLVTLFGEGGVGKTRLALEVVQSFLSPEHSSQETNKLAAVKNFAFPHGVWFVSLSGITASEEFEEHLAAVIAHTLEFRLNGNQSLFAQLIAFLRKKSLLLLLDNAEHLLPNISDIVVRILQNTTQMKILVTSRHLLNLQAEYVWRVGGLALPTGDVNTLLSHDEIVTFSSIALFVERANQIKPNFQLTLENQADILAICRIVDGLPLAIELAAGLTRQLSCAEIFTSLQSGLNMLTASFTDLSPRHRSIINVLDYSWQFLDDNATQVLASCSIFAGDFTLAAAVEIACTSEVTLLKLVDQSLMQLHDGRFTLHRLIRQYAAEKLAHRPELRQLCATRHATFYFQFLHKMEASLSVDLDAPNVIQKELSNVHVAWNWTVEQRDLHLLALGVNSMEYYYRLASSYSEVIHLFEQALDAVRQKSVVDPSDGCAQQLRILLLCHIAQFCRLSGRAAKAQNLMQEARELESKVNDPALLGLIYHELARLAQIRSDHDNMRALAEQANQYARQSQRPHLIVETLNDIGVAYSFSIHHSAATPYFYEALNLLKDAPDHYMQLRLALNIGGGHMQEHQYAPAIYHLQRVISLQRRFKVHASNEIPLIFQGELWQALGQYDAARKSYEEAKQQFEFAHNPYWESWLDVSLGRLYCLLGDPITAITTLKEVKASTQERGMQMQYRWATITLGHAFSQQGNHPAARECYQQTVQLPQHVNWTYRAADAQAGLAASLLALDDRKGALVYTESALATLAEQGLYGAYEPFQVYWTCVTILKANQDPRADEILRTAYQALQKIANDLDDATLRHSFLNNVVANRNLVALAHQAGIQ